MGLAFYCLYSLSLDETKVNKEFLKRTKKPDVHFFFLSFFLSLFCQTSSYVSTNINKLNGFKRNNRNLKGALLTSLVKRYHGNQCFSSGLLLASYQVNRPCHGFRRHLDEVGKRVRNNTVFA